MSLRFSAAFFDHGHIYQQIRGLVEAGARLASVFEPRVEKLEPVRDILAAHGAVQARSFDELLDDRDTLLVTTAAVPDERCPLGLRVMDAGKDYFTDKAPFVCLEQLEMARRACKETGRKYAVFYSERICSEAAWHAGELIADGAIGRVVQVLNLAPHTLWPDRRPEWFFRKPRTGGILTDIGSHQFEQFLSYASATDAEILSARVENFATPEHPEFEDFGEASLRLNSGASAYCRIDWLSPAASRTWGDARCFVLGTDGYLELRKNIELGRPHEEEEVIYLVNNARESRIPCKGRIGQPFFRQLLEDIVNRTETAMTQAHAFKAAELSLRAQGIADLSRARG